MENNVTKQKLSMVTKIGYGIGGACDTIPYYLFGTYFMFFLTDVAGVPAGIAGTISFVAIIFQAVAGPIVAYISDNSLNPGGRRKPYILKIAIPFAIITALLFFPVGGNLGVKIVYYSVLAILFYICYAAFTSVWAALGAELTQDYKERNNVRSFVAYIAMPYSWLASSGVIGLVGLFSSANIDYGKSWFYAVLILAACMAIGGFITWKTANENPPVYTEEEKSEIRAKRFSFKSLLVEYAGFYKIKVYRKVILFTLIFVIGYVMMNNGTVYMMTSVLGLNEAQQSLFWTLNIGISLICIPIVFGIANKWDKKRAMLLFVGLYGVTSVLFFLMSLVKELTFVDFVVFSGCVALGTTAFYSLMYSLLYDCCNVYTLATGEQKEGGMLALQYLAQTIGGAIAALLLGWGLQLFGYSEAATVSAFTAKGVLALGTVVPAVFVGISMIFLVKYNLTREKYEEVIAAIEDRKDGKEIDMTRFEDLI